MEKAVRCLICHSDALSNTARPANDVWLPVNVSADFESVYKLRPELIEEGMYLVIHKMLGVVAWHKGYEFIYAKPALKCMARCCRQGICGLTIGWWRHKMEGEVQWSWLVVDICSDPDELLS